MHAFADLLDSLISYDSMNVIMVGPFGLRRRGTMIRRALPMAAALVARGHRVMLLLPPWDSLQDAGRTFTWHGVRVINISLTPAWAPGQHVQITLRLLRVLLTMEPSVVHCFKPKAYAGLVHLMLWLLRRAGWWRGRLVVDADDWEGPGGWNDAPGTGYTWAQRQFFAWQERFGLTHADALTLASAWLVRRVSMMGVPLERVHYVPNGVEVPTIGGSEAVILEKKPETVLLYTRFVETTPVKVVSLWRQIVARRPGARLLVVGDGEQGQAGALRRLATAAGLGRSVVCLGWVPTETLPGVLAAGDVALVSVADTIINRARSPVKLLELMAAGVPPVAQAVGEFGRIVVDGESGSLLPPGDDKGLADGVMQLLVDETLRQRLAQGARQRVQREYNWNRLAEEVERAYAGS
ncbi:MAG TPA: glycosyltransferase family 1 protein [Anaerolineae bacterium]|nr:glycosyltransferase family 1 protein [Anaerolineae bacterium]